MLKGQLTKEQLNLIVDMVRVAGEKQGPSAFPILGDLMRALAEFKPEVIEPEIMKDLEDG